MGFWIGVAIVVAIIAVIVRRGFQMKALANHGVLGKAEVIGKHRRRTNAGHQAAGFIKYRFEAPGGFSLTNRVAVSEEIFSQYQEGDTIDVVYLEAKPSVNGTRYMVNLSRQALKLPPL